MSLCCHIINTYMKELGKFCHHQLVGLFLFWITGQTTRNKRILFKYPNFFIHFGSLFHMEFSLFSYKTEKKQEYLFLSSQFVRNIFYVHTHALINISCSILASKCDVVLTQSTEILTVTEEDRVVINFHHNLDCSIVLYFQ